MSRRIEQLNEQLKKELANLIIKKVALNNGLITVCFVNCSTDLKHAKIAISILPDKFGPSVLKKLRKLSSAFNQELKNKLRIRQIPRFRWVLDTTESRAAEIEKVIKQINEEEKIIN
ncbi:30S ribosome-binding factor RbfA [Patescibacteria group bacterium]|nr:30S ribosome-binding factor RbfA [Patescibacteria group bacterium]MBU1663457.1 30S ribosome-binding factor RbfA [Patescibacteria group bacterium]MBU1934110.1 30S ribosome-binding factor RbfA [Patescibacteria group bacterium]MBU2007755.1 30S ribosome-binding factor RbfA [Patescibacteria group bacterium]MBU2233880.1 30S ribosome-binding factor RbfA [Patescibacteria group bacterium]